MAFLGVYRAVYDYVPQAQGELAISEGDLLFVLEKSTDDDWWKAKKKAVNDDDDEPEGLIPNNYIEEVSVFELCRGAEADSEGQTDPPSQGSLRLHQADGRGNVLCRRHTSRRIRRL